jgi:signal transduction histidine kinase
MFSARLSAAIGALAILFLAQGAVGWWVVDVAQGRVERGRIAGDLQASFVDLAATKQRLRTWSLQTVMGAAPPRAEGDRLSQALIDRIGVLKDLHRRAESFDRMRGKDLPEHAERAGALAVLEPSFAGLRRAVLALEPVQPASDPVSVWQALERIFDVAGAEDLRTVVNDRIAREATALARERAAADASLARVKQIAWSAAALLTLLALGLAIYFAMALRGPLAALGRGAQALEAGDLSHRLPDRAPDEFGQFARSVNRMADELQARRAEEATARQRLEARVAEQTADLQMALASLQDSEARRRQLLSEISHELRTPTTAIRGEAEIALRGGDRPAAAYRDTLQRIGDAAVQLGNVINDLLTVARTDADALTVRLAPTDLRGAVEAAVKHARGQASVREVGLDVGAMPDELRVEADPPRLVQLIGLILDNAIRYSYAGGSVRVAIRRVDGAEGRRAALTVEDQGIGIEPAEIERIFDRHFRGRQARAHRPDGAGIGLAIAEALAERQGIALSVRSEPGAGATFSLTFELLSRLEEQAAQVDERVSP